MWRRFLAFLLFSGIIISIPRASAQTPTAPNEIEARVKGNVQDLGEIWVLKFRFYAPRLITVDIPGRGRRLCWYMLYEVSNPDPKEPHRFVPDFELVTLDKPGVYHDQVLPVVQKAVQKIEDPTGHLDIKNSVTIASHPLPPAKPDAVPKWVTGVAIWDDVDPETNAFSIFVSGLSNGWSVDDKDVLRRKTLQLNFRRVGDRFSKDSRDIRFVRPEEWVYRALSSSKGAADRAKPADDKTDKPTDPTIKSETSPTSAKSKDKSDGS